MSTSIRLVVFMFVLGAAAHSADAAKPKSEAFSGKEEEFKGALAIKGLDAKEGVAAMIKVSNGDKVEWVDLLATGDTAKKLDDIASKRGEVTVTGIRTADGIKVTKLGDDVKLPPDKKRKKK